LKGSQKLDAVWIEDSLIQQALRSSMNFRQNAAQLLNHAAEQQIFNWISLELGTGGAQ
jgi:hypothetical protein